MSLHSFSRKCEFLVVVVLLLCCFFFLDCKNTVVKGSLFYKENRITNKHTLAQRTNSIRARNECIKIHGVPGRVAIVGVDVKMMYWRGGDQYSL